MGINNVGWSIINEEKMQIEKSGVRLFKISSSAEERRNFRSSRRRKKRKYNRIKDILKLLGSIDFPSENTIDSNLLEKRVKGLKTKISKQDIANICCYYASHRGYIPFGDEERELINLDNKYPCEYYYQLLQERGKFRALQEVVDNKDLIREYKEIINKQLEYYPELIKVKDEILNTVERKREFWQGPGSEKSRTDYGRFKTEKYKLEHGLKNDLEYLYDDLIGKCSICIGEKTVPVSNYYYEVFNLLNDFINTSIKSIDNLTKQNAVYLDKNTGYYKLTSDSLNTIINYCKQNPNLKYNDIFRDLFGLKKEDLIGYRIDKNYKPTFSTMNFYRLVKNTFETFNSDWIDDIDEYNNFIRILAISPGIVETKNLIEKYMKHSFSDKEYELIKEISSKLKSKGGLKYGALSEKILKKSINDMMSTNQNFMQVRRKFDYDKESRDYFIKSYKETEGIYLMDEKFVDDIIASPQVKKSLRQSIKVINSIITEKKAFPDVIAVESTNELNNDSKRKLIEKEQKINESARTSAREYIINNFGDSYVSEKNITKVMLYNELDGICPYCGKPFKDGLNSIIKSNIEIEHILPLSKSFNDSYNNKTLSCRSCNSNKSDRSPYMWMGPEKFDEFSERIKKLPISEEKKTNFLETNDLDKYNTRFFNRNLRDTSYATSELINQIKIYNDFLDNKLDGNVKIRTLSAPGQLTYKIRKNLGIDKDRDAGKFHHAVDASIVGGIALDNGIGSILLESQNEKEFWIKKKYLGNRIDELIFNYNNSILDDQLRNIKSDNDIKISEQVDKDFNKSLANSNVYKYLKIGNDFKKVEQISNIYDEKIMTNKIIKNLFDDNDKKVNLMIKDNNPKMYKKLKNIFEQYNNKGPSSNPFINYCLEVNNISIDEFDYTKFGIKQENGPIVKKLRYYTTANIPNLLSNKNMKKNTYIGLDSVGQAYTKVYWDKDKLKFIFLPIYSTSIDLKNNKLNKNDKTYKQFYDLYLKGKNYQFVVNLYNGNHVTGISSTGEKITGNISYYHKTNNFICLKNKKNIGTTIKQLIVYDVDCLGNEKIRLTWPSD
jgi:CRISPR-associated endonuclease Csn1